jgi:excinuclease ABC subunit B
MVVITPANEYIMNRDRLDESIARIKGEKNERVEYFKKMGKLIEMQRIGERVDHDIEMLLELGYCNGIENYSRHLELRNKGDCPYTLFDFLNKDEWLLVVDESHITMPQIRGMYEGDKSRKEKLVEYG